MPTPGPDTSPFAKQDTSPFAKQRRAQAASQGPAAGHTSTEGELDMTEEGLEGQPVAPKGLLKRVRAKGPPPPTQGE